MKILLIYPPKRNIVATTLPEGINQERGFNPPLGLLYLASYLKSNSSHQVQILDTQVECLDYSNLQSRIKDIRPDLVGIQTLTFTLIDVLKTASLIKSYSPQTPVVLGGPHISLYPQESLAFKNIDYIVMGEGEFAFAKLVSNLGSRQELRKIGGVGFKQNGNFYINSNCELISDLDALPYPDRRMLPYQKYYSLLSKNFPITTMMTSRGCPFQCIFCGVGGRKWRARSAEKVVDEIEDCLRLGIKEIFFHDDTFTIDRRRVLDICSEIGRRNLQFYWDVRSRADTIDYELLKTMKRYGCIRVSFGVESGNPQILKNLKKGITLKQAEGALRICKELHIETLTDFMIGSPGETPAHINETIRFVKRLKPGYVQFSVATPYPGTELYRMALSEGVLSRDVWKEFAQNPTVNFVSPLWTESLSREQLMRLLNKVYRQFYLSGWFIIKEALGIKSLKELFLKIRAALKLYKKTI